MAENQINTVDTGLAKVPVCTSDISFTTVGKDGKPILMYRGYSIYDLVKGPFEESVYLILNNRMPNKKELDDFTGLLKDNMFLNEETTNHLKTYPKNAHLMDLLLTAFSFVRMYDADYENHVWRDIKGEITERSKLLLDAGVRMGAKIPAMYSYGYRHLKGLAPIPPDRNLSVAGNILNMLGIPLDDEAVNALNTTLILYLDHTINCSTFTSLVTESSGVDPYGPHIAASVALKGVLHGGANDLAAIMFEEIGRPENAESYLKKKLDNKEIVFGFGHRLAHYKGNVESRVMTTEKVGRPIAEKKGMTYLWEIYDIIKRVMLEEKGRAPNLDLPVAVLYKTLGIPVDCNTPIFQASRHYGWVANMKRQRDSKGPLYRPTQVYTGPGLDDMKEYIPVEKR